MQIVKLLFYLRSILPQRILGKLDMSPEFIKDHLQLLLKLIQQQQKISLGLAKSSLHTRCMDLKEILTWQSKCGKKKEEKQQASNPFSLTFFKKETNGSAVFFSGNIKNVNSHHLCRTYQLGYIEKH